MPLSANTLFHFTRSFETLIGILPLKRQLVTIKGGFSHNAVELLTTRIISMERIKQDL